MLINIHTHKSTQLSTELVSIHAHEIQDAPQFPFSIGLHPWYAEKPIRPDILELVQNKLCWAIGECGLDKLKGPNLESQLIVFEQMVRLSELFEKPLIIHCVRALNELLACKKRLNPLQPWILHGLSRENWIDLLLESDIFISVGEVVLKRESMLHAVVAKVPAEKLFLETDDTETSIREVYESISTAKRLTLDALEKQIEDNFISVFGYGKLA